MIEYIEGEKMLLLGIDVGTTGAKAAVFDENGCQKGYAFEEYDVICPGPGLFEQDAEKVWSITKSVIGKAVDTIGQQISAMSLSVQGDAVIAINQNRTAISPAYLGMDYRGTKETKDCIELFGDRYLFQLTGMRPHPMNTLIKILWIKNNLPDLYENAYKFVTYADFILGKLGSDDIVIDYPMASRTMAFDIHFLQWSGEILGKLNISEKLLGKPVPSGKVVGKINQELASELNINSNALLITGGHDQTCAALGAGIIQENMALDSHGTAEVISTAFPQLQINDIMYQGYYPCYIYTVPNMYFTFSLNHTGGILLRWFVENFCYEDAVQAENTGKQLYDYIINRMKDGPSPLLVLPHFNGSGTPTCDIHSKGAFLGLTMATTRYDIAKAIIESLSYEVRINLDTMRKAGIQINHLRSVGGGARSTIGLQNKADILGIPVSTLKVREAACLGASMLAGIATGVYKNAKDASNIVSISDTYYPRSDIHSQYNQKYDTYSSLYGLLKDLRY